MNKQEFLEKILNEIFEIRSPQIDNSRKDKILEFINTTVNGDEIKTYLVIDVVINDKAGIYVYILTNFRLIQVNIGSQGINSSSFLLREIIGVERKLIDNNRMAVQINFQTSNFQTSIVGLKYSSTNQKVTEFFQGIEQTWTKGV